jgi:hypothetical protein
MQSADEYISHQAVPCLQRQMVRPISLQEPKSGSQRAAPHSALRNGMGKAVTQTEVRLKGQSRRGQAILGADNKNAYINRGSCPLQAFDNNPRRGDATADETKAGA